MCFSAQHGGQKLSMIRVSKVIVHHVVQMCLCAALNCVCVCLVSLPKLKEMDWRVDMVTGSDSISRLSVPTCLVQFKVRTEEMGLCVIRRPAK